MANDPRQCPNCGVIRQIVNDEKGMATVCGCRRVPFRIAYRDDAKPPASETHSSSQSINREPLSRADQIKRNIAKGVLFILAGGVWFLAIRCGADRPYDDYTPHRDP